MDEGIDEDVLSYFANDSDEDDADSADELLGMLSCSKTETKEKAKSTKSLRNDTDDEEDEQCDEATEAEIAALEAKLALLKKKKKSSPPAKSNKAVKNSDKVHHDVSSCKHGKSISECFFCSNPPSVEKPDLKNSETKIVRKSSSGQQMHRDVSSCKHGTPISECFFCLNPPPAIDKPVLKNLKTQRQKKSRVAAAPAKQRENDITDIFAILPTIDGESALDLSKKRRLAHSENVNRDNQNPSKKAKVGGSLKEKQKVKTNLPNNFSSSSSTKVESLSKGNAHVFAGIEIGNPVLSSTVFEERIKGRKLVKISKIETTMKGRDIEGDWVTVGVVVRKVTQKKSSSGKNFCVWHLSDLGLGTENNVCGLFLFGECYNHHWKIQTGRTIALLNPEIMKQEDKSVSIKIDHPNKLMELGCAKFFGGCKGSRKSDSKPCTMYINKKYGDYCEYHVNAAFKKAKSGRMDLQSGGRAPNKKGKMLQNLQRDISAGEFHYGGQTVRLDEKGTSKSKSSSKEKTDASSSALKSLMGHQVRMLAALEFNEAKLKKEEEAKLTKKESTAKSFLKNNRNELLNLTMKKENLGASSGADVRKKPEKIVNKSSMNQIKNDRNLKFKLDNVLGVPAGSQKVKHCAIDFFVEKGQNDKEIPTKQNNSSDKLPVEKLNSYPEKETIKKTEKIHTKLGGKLNPVLGRGLKNDDFLEFTPDDDDFCYEKYTGEDLLTPNPTILKKGLTKSVKMDEQNKHVPLRSTHAKNKAISVVQRKGPIELEDPNIDIAKKKSTKSLKDVEKLIEKCGNSSGEQKIQKKKSLLAGVLGHIDLNSEDGKKLLEQKSKHVGVVKLAEAEREERYFDSLEKKENMLEKMSSIYEIKVKGVACRECHYLAESQSDLCKELNHPIAKISNMVKRFFICKGCKQRCCSYNKLFPKNACTRCGERNFEKTTMVVQRTGPVLETEKLELRGPEKKYLISNF